MGHRCRRGLDRDHGNRLRADERGSGVPPRRRQDRSRHRGQQHGGQRHTTNRSRPTYHDERHLRSQPGPLPGQRRRELAELPQLPDDGLSRRLRPPPPDACSRERPPTGWSNTGPRGFSIGLKGEPATCGSGGCRCQRRAGVSSATVRSPRTARADSLRCDTFQSPLVEPASFQLRAATACCRGRRCPRRRSTSTPKAGGPATALRCASTFDGHARPRSHTTTPW
jgi:hypothetical protein